MALKKEVVKGVFEIMGWDINSLYDFCYQKVYESNRRLKRFRELDAPEILIYNEKILLQEAVDECIIF